MTEFQMPEQTKKAEFVRSNFDVIASKYDLFNDLNSFFLHRSWKNAIIKKINLLQKKEKLTCLDLCCGTGDISVRISKIKNLDKLYAIDFSEKMISFAKERLKENSKAIVEIGDATNLSRFKNESIDVVTIGFGLRNVDNLEKTLSEIFRVLKKDGIFINLDVGKVKNPVIKFFADFYFFKIVPIIGYLIWGSKNDMFDYLPVSSLSYPDQVKLKEKIEISGFKKVEFQNYVFGNVAMHIAEKSI